MIPWGTLVLILGFGSLLVFGGKWGEVIYVCVAVVVTIGGLVGISVVLYKGKLAKCQREAERG